MDHGGKKPPVFQCQANHAACGGCAASRSNRCASCVDGVYEHNHWLDPYILASKVRCPNEAYGCRSSVAYCMVDDHRLVCPHAPCCCPEPGCIFLASPPTLRDHLASHHKLLVTPIAYGKCVLLEMRPSEGRGLLAAEDGEHVYLVVASERGGDGPSWYRCKVWTHAPVDPETGCLDVLMLEDKVWSCARPCEEAAMEAGGRCLHVPSHTTRRRQLEGSSCASASTSYKSQRPFLWPISLGKYRRSTIASSGEKVIATT